MTTTITPFDNNGRVGKVPLAYHLAHMPAADHLVRPGQVVQRPVRLDRRVKAYERWLWGARPELAGSVRSAHPCSPGSSLKHRGLMPMAEDARKPMFDLSAGEAFAARVAERAAPPPAVGAA